MKKAIWKFPIPPMDGEEIVLMPKGAKILSVREQSGYGIIYAIVDPKAEKENVVFDIFATGQEFEANHYREYIGTFARPANSLIFHVFKRIE